MTEIRSLFEPHRCRVCQENGPSRTMTVLQPGQRSEDFQLCATCWAMLESGFRRTSPDSTPEPFLDSSTVRLTEPQLRGLIEVGLQADGDTAGTLAARRGLTRQRLVRGELREIGADLEDAVEASGRGDWAAALLAVRMIQGRSVIARRALEGMLGSYPTDTDLPPLVRAVQSVGQVISDFEVDALAPHELRARMHAVLQVLDRELLAFLEPPEDTPLASDCDRDTPPGGFPAPKRL